MKLLGMQTVPGQALDCALPVPGYQPLEAVLLCGEQPGKTLVVTAGVHGCEYNRHPRCTAPAPRARSAPPARTDHPAAAA